MELKNNLKEISYKLENILKNAKEEENCTEKENIMYADMKNLVESINEYLS